MGASLWFWVSVCTRFLSGPGGTRDLLHWQGDFYHIIPIGLPSGRGVGVCWVVSVLCDVRGGSGGMATTVWMQAGVGAEGRLPDLMVCSGGSTLYIALFSLFLGCI